jgi:hypothetical protein
LRVRARSLTLVALLAAVYTAVSLLPGFPVIGAPGAEIDFARSLEMGYGLVLGPVLGPITSFLGAIVGKILTGGGVGLLFTPLAIVSSLMAAAMGRRLILRVRGWLISAVLLAGVIAAWYATPTGQYVPLYPIPHLIGLGIILLLRERITEYLLSREKGRLTLGVLLSSYPSTMAGQMLGNLIFIQFFSPSPLFFMAILPITVVERVAISVIATVIGTPLVLAVRGLSPELLQETQGSGQ